MKRKNEERQAFDPAPFTLLMVLGIVSGLGMVGLCLYKFFQYREIYQSREFWVAFSVFLGVVVAIMLLSPGLRHGFASSSPVGSMGLSNKSKTGSTSDSQRSRMMSSIRRRIRCMIRTSIIKSRPGRARKARP